MTNDLTTVRINEERIKSALCDYVQKLGYTLAVDPKIEIARNDRGEYYALVDVSEWAAPK